MTSNNTPSVDERLRALRCLERRIEGETWQQIADAEGYADRSGPARAVQRLLDRTEFEGVEEYRALEADRLDYAHRTQVQFLKSLKPTGEPAVVTAAAAAVSTIVRISARRSRLLGLDAPTRLAVGQPGEDFAETAAKLLTELAEVGAVELSSRDE